MTTTHVIDDVSIAASALCEGLLVAFPTETVYGLGADATNPEAIQRLFEAKGRPSDNPLIVHLGDVSQLPQVALSVTEAAQKLLDNFSPGPITVVVEKSSNLANSVSAGLSSVGVRIPDHPQARELLRLVKRPVAAPSANLSGRPSCTTWQSVFEDLGGRVDFILRGEVSRIGIESTVVDCTRVTPVLLRHGAVNLEQLKVVLPNIVAWNDRTNRNEDSLLVKPASPGLRHAHYQPQAGVRLVVSLEEALKSAASSRYATYAYFGIKPLDLPQGGSLESKNTDLNNHFAMTIQFPSIAEFARNFYEALREADRQGIEVIFLQLAPDELIGKALRDRQLRSAGLSDPSQADPMTP